MSAWAKPGAQCVCVRDDWHGPEYRDAPSRLPMINEVLTVKEVLGEEAWGFSGRIPGGAGLSFSELGHDWFFAIASFRPILTRTQEQDASLFKHHLDGLPAGANA